MDQKIPDDEMLTGRLRLAVTRLARVLRQRDESEMPPTDVAILTSIAWAGEPTLSSLAIAEHVARPTVTKSINKLEADGLIERVTDTEDGRVTRVRLSPAGRRRVSIYRKRVNPWLEEMLENIPSRDRAGLEETVLLLEHLVEQARQ